MVAADLAGIRQMGRNIMLTLSRQLAVVVLGILLSVLLARLLGPSGIGQYAIAILLPMMLASLLNLGIAPANVYFVGRGEVSVQTALATTVKLWSVLIGVGVGLGAFAVMVWGGAWFPGTPRPLLWIALAIFPILLLRDLLASVLQGVQDFRRYNRLMLAAPAATLGAAAVAVGIFRWGVGGALLATAAGGLCGLIAAYTALRSYRSPARTSAFSVSPIRYGTKCLAYGWKAHLSNILSFLNYRADVFLLNFLLNPAAAGVYVVAVQLAERLWILSQAASTVMLPRLSELHDREDQRRFLTPLVTRWMLLISIVGAIVLALCAEPLINFLFGGRYGEASTALLWLLPGIVLGGASRVIANDLAARGRPELNMYVAVLVVTVNISANLLLIPLLGITGAAIATTLAYGLNATVKLWLYCRISGVPWLQTIWFGSADIEFVRSLAASRAGYVSPTR